MKSENMDKVRSDIKKIDEMWGKKKSVMKKQITLSHEVLINDDWSSLTFFSWSGPQRWTWQISIHRQN